MNALETVATILIVLPALLYAAGCLLNTEVMVAMLPERIPAIRVLVRGRGVAFLVSAILLNFERFASAAGWIGDHHTHVGGRAISAIEI